jgi:hypothetical protein
MATPRDQDNSGPKEGRARDAQQIANLFDRIDDSGYQDVGRINVNGFTCYTNLHAFYFHGNGPSDLENVNMGYRDSWFMNTAEGKIFAITYEGSYPCATQGLTISGSVYV